MAEQADPALIAEADHVAGRQLLRRLDQGLPARAVEPLDQRRLDLRLGVPADAAALSCAEITLVSLTTSWSPARAIAADRQRRGRAARRRAAPPASARNRAGSPAAARCCSAGSSKSKRSVRMAPMRSMPSGRLPKPRNAKLQQVDNSDADSGVRRRDATPNASVRTLTPRPAPCAP